MKAEREAAGSKMDNAGNLETRGPLQDKDDGGEGSKRKRRRSDRDPDEHESVCNWVRRTFSGQNPDIPVVL